MPADSMFLFAEAREHPMHVGGLSLFEPPESASREFVRDFYPALAANREFQPTFGKLLAPFMDGIICTAWIYDDRIDIDYHLRRSALSSSGWVRDLLELTSRLRTSLLDRHRPLWKLCVVEGLRDGRLGLDAKVHHGLLGGISAMKMMQRTLSVDPDDPEVRAMWNVPGQQCPRSGGSTSLGSLTSTAKSVVG